MGVLGYGFYASNIAVGREPVARVDQKVITARELVKRLKQGGQNLPPGELQVRASLALERMQTEELLQNGTRRLGLTASPQEIETAIKASLNLKEGEEGKFPEVYAKLLKDVRLSDQEYRQVVEVNILINKLRQHLDAQIPQETEFFHLLGIQLKDATTAQNLWEILTRGEDFAVVAQASLDEESKAKGGDMGWLPRGLRPELEAAFDLELGALSQPISTPDGFHYILKLAGKETRPVDPDTRKKLLENALESWLEQERKQQGVETLLSSKRLAWVVAQAR